MKKTALYDVHIGLKARMVSFAGFQMPVEYSGITQEHLAVRNTAGLFDISHMGEFWVKGPGALQFLQNVTTNDVSSLEQGQAQYSCMTYANGGIVDDIIVYHFEKNKYLLVVNASNMEKDFAWLEQNLATYNDVVLEDASNKTSLLALQGPSSLKILQKICKNDLAALKPFHFISGKISDLQSDVIISATGYTGAGGFEIFCYNDDAIPLWNAISEAGLTEGLFPAGLAARDTLRLEMAYCLYGNDINEHTTPIEAGLGWIVKLAEGKKFPGIDIIKQQKENGTQKKLTGFITTERGIPRSHYPIFNKDGKNIGEVASGSISPISGKGMGMGYIESGETKTDNQIMIGIRNKMVAARIVKPPFYQY